MIYFHGSDKKWSYFEGWYFSHKKDGLSLAFIPGMSVDRSGRRSAFIQIISNGGSYNIPYDYSVFSADKNRLHISIGGSVFTSESISVDIKNKEISCLGRLTYGPLTPIAYDIMGPFSLLPFMECSHGIVSMGHSLGGSLTAFGREMGFDGGRGYIETDWGRSFPEKYVWVQCNSFEDSSLSIMASAASIPFLGGVFSGVICAVLHDGREYRMATYTGARVSRRTADELIIRQGGRILKVNIIKARPHKLYAPDKGSMSRIIHENASCTALFRFYDQGRLLFASVSDNASFEYAY